MLTVQETMLYHEKCKINQKIEKRGYMSFSNIYFENFLGGVLVCMGGIIPIVILHGNGKVDRIFEIIKILGETGNYFVWVLLVLVFFMGVLLDAMIQEPYKNIAFWVAKCIKRPYPLTLKEASVRKQILRKKGESLEFVEYNKRKQLVIGLRFLSFSIIIFIISLSLGNLWIENQISVVFINLVAFGFFLIFFGWYIHRHKRLMKFLIKIT